jgi:two-component system, NarL family, invasion response regulator UvrY
METKMIKIFIADDHELVREGLKKILKEEHDIKVVDEADNGDEVLDKIQKIECDIILLDMNMPGKSGLDLIKELKTKLPNLHILVLSIYPEEKYALRSLKAGASGYITKDSAIEELVSAIRRIHDRGRYVSATLADKLASQIDSNSDLLPHERLSDRELQIMCMIASNKSVKEIANELYLSISTVNTYRSRIQEKMNMKTDIELTHYAIYNNLVE